MSRFLKVFAIAALALFIIVPVASAQRGFGGRGGFYRGGFYGGGWGWYGPGWGWGWYGPYGWGWGYPYGYSPYGDEGKVKIVNVPKDSIVYVDGGYAGTAGELKKFSLRPGEHNIELRDPSGHAFHKERIQVIAGKTLEIHGSEGGH
jgi:hypothetical protein